LWNLAAFYLFLLRWSPALSSLIVLALIVATFLPFHVLHPIRTLRLRWLTLALMALWAVLALYTLLRGFDIGEPVVFTLCVIAVYVVASDAAIRFLRSFKS
jgi:phosphatidylcholine synthase